MTKNRISLFVIFALVMGAVAPAAVPHHGALAEYAAAGNALIKLLADVKDEATATTAQPFVATAVTRYNAARAALKKLTFDQANAEHKNAVEHAAKEIQDVSTRLA